MESSRVVTRESQRQKCIDHEVEDVDGEVTGVEEMKRVGCRVVGQGTESRQSGGPWHKCRCRGKTLSKSCSNVEEAHSFAGGDTSPPLGCAVELSSQDALPPSVALQHKVVA